MKKIAILYGSSTGSTEFVASKIKNAIGDAELFNVNGLHAIDLLPYEYYILGAPTFGVKKLQQDWADFLPTFLKQDLSNKKVALFGLGDSEAYSDTFVNGMGMIYRTLNDRTKIVGSVSTKGYFFDNSDALVGGRFVGLALDEDNEQKLTDSRINPWVENLRQSFNLHS